MTEWLTASQVAAMSGRHVVTVWRALECGELHGHQRRRKGKWQVAASAVDAWIQGANGVAACGCKQLRLVRKSA